MLRCKSKLIAHSPPHRTAKPAEHAPCGYVMGANRCQCNVACTAVHRPNRARMHWCSRRTSHAVLATTLIIICAAGAPRMRCLQPLLLLFVQPGHLACGACNHSYYYLCSRGTSHAVLATRKLSTSTAYSPTTQRTQRSTALCDETVRARLRVRLCLCLHLRLATWSIRCACI
jgi:hypothetical protein